MTGHPQLPTRLGILLACAAGGLLLITAFDRTPLDQPEWVSIYRDDAYYCFAWARSVVQGEGARVGAAAPTSGVHVGWELLLLPLAALGDEVLERGARWLGLLCLLAAGAVLIRTLVRERVPRALAVTAGLLLVGRPDVWLEAQNGQETALGALLLNGLLHARRASLPGFTILCVIATAARSDLWLFAAAIAVLARDERSWRRLLAPAIALLCYATWNLLLTGRPLQDSAEPMAWLFEQRFAAEEPTTADRLADRWWWGRPVLLAGPFLKWAPLGAAVLAARSLPGVGSASRRMQRLLPRIALPAMLVGWAVGFDDLEVPTAAALLWLVLPELPASRTARALLLASLGLAFLHYVLRRYPRDYYFVPLTVCGCYALGRLGADRPRLAAAVMLLALAGAALDLVEAPRRFEWQRSMDLAGRYLDRFSGEPAAPVGCFNSGLVTWRRSGPVVNLDGVVNHPPFAALQAGELGAWLERRGIRLLCDNPVQFERDATLPHACGRWFGSEFDPARNLREVARFTVPGEAGDRPGTEAFVLYRYSRTGEFPVLDGEPAVVRAIPDEPTHALYGRGGEEGVLTPPR